MMVANYNTTHHKTLGSFKLLPNETKLYNSGYMANVTQ